MERSSSTRKSRNRNTLSASHTNSHGHSSSHMDGDYDMGRMARRMEQSAGDKPYGIRGSRSISVFGDDSPETDPDRIDLRDPYRREEPAGQQGGDGQKDGSRERDGGRGGERDGVRVFSRGGESGSGSGSVSGVGQNVTVSLVGGIRPSVNNDNNVTSVRRYGSDDNNKNSNNYQNSVVTNSNTNSNANNSNSNNNSSSSSSAVTAQHSNSILHQHSQLNLRSPRSSLDPNLPRSPGSFPSRAQPHSSPEPVFSERKKFNSSTNIRNNPNQNSNQNSNTNLSQNVSGSRDSGIRSFQSTNSSMNRSYDDNVRNSTDRNHTESGRTYVSTEFVRKSPDRVVGREGGSGRGSVGVGSGESNGDVKSSRDGNYLNDVTSSQDGGSSSSGVGMRSESGTGNRSKINNINNATASAVGLRESSSKLNSYTPHSTTQGGPSTLGTYRKNIAGNNGINNNNNSSSSSGLSGRNTSVSPPFTHEKPLVKAATSFSTSKSAIPFDPVPTHFKDSKNSETDTGMSLCSAVLNFV
jgi:hypothetical protein